MFRKIITIVLFSLALKLSGQVTGSFKYADSLTYNLYTEKCWNALIVEGNRYLRDGLDYYYMRMRIGIAYYEKHNYVKSANHFRKALEFNENDQIALEYLFYSYSLSGRTPLSWALLSSFYPQNWERIIKESKIKKNSMTIESFFSDAKTDEILSDPDSWFSNPGAGSQIATKYFINNELYATHVIGKNVGYFHSLTNLVKVNYLHYYDGTKEADLFPQTLKQNQYYGSLNIFSRNGWLFSPSLHLLTAGYPIITNSTTGMNSSVTTVDVRSNGFHTGVAVTKSMGYLAIGTEAGFSNLNYMKRLQGTASILVYPFGNSDIYFGGKIATVQELQNNSITGIVKGFTAGFTIARKVWFELSGLSGDINNYTDKNGLYIYTSADILKSKLSGRIIIPFTKAGLSIYLGGGTSSYSSEFIPLDGTISNFTNTLNYNNINFSGGITWNF
jgi:tetratricopeptide (TPR) repeat protein